MASTVYNQIFSYVNNTCTAYISANVSAVASAIAPAAYSLLGVYVILWGLANIRGLIKEPILDGFVRVAKIGIIFGIGIQLASYSAYVTDTFFNAPEVLAGTLVGGTQNATAISTLDVLLDRGFAIGKGFWDKGGLLDGDFGMYFVAIFTWAITIMVTAYACFLIVLAKIALALVIALGPIFIISLLFQPTANFFNSWIQQLANYGLLIILVVGANIFIIDLFVRFSDPGVAAASTAQVDKVFPFIITGVISLLVLAQLPQVAAGLAGGISLSSYGMGRLGLAVLARGGRQAAARTKQAAERPARYVARKAADAYRRRTGTVKRS